MISADERTNHPTEFLGSGATSSSGLHRHERPPRLRPLKLLALAIALAGAAFIGAAAAIATFDAGNEAVASTETAAIAEPAPSATGFDPAFIAAAVVDSVVTVQVGTENGSRFVATSSGSGVVLDDAGHIASNDHVVAGASEVRIVLSDGRVYPAEIIGSDPLTDLAVVRISASDLRPIDLGSTVGLDVGAPAVAVGSPLGLEGGPSLSVGVISALGREVQTGPGTILYGMLQTDAPITSGSSGGALVDSSGRLIGITTAVGVSQIGVEGIGFATPVEIVDRVTGEIIATGSVSHGLLGISGTTAYEPTDDGGAASVGVSVDSVAADSGADAAGVTRGDVITAVDGIPVNTMDELITALRLSSGGDSIVVDLGDGRSFQVVLGTR